jgi:hypothetical protein
VKLAKEKAIPFIKQKLGGVKHRIKNFLQDKWNRLKEKLGIKKPGKAGKEGAERGAKGTSDPVSNKPEKLSSDEAAALLNKAEKLSPEEAAAFLGKVDKLNPAEAATFLNKIDNMTPDLVTTFLNKVDRLNPQDAMNLLRKAEGLPSDEVARVVNKVPQNNGWVLPKEGGGARIGNRLYTEHALERMAPRTPQVMAEIEARALKRAEAKGLQVGTPEFGAWWQKNGPDPRGIPPSVVEAEITNPGSTSIKVITNNYGVVVTVIPSR